MPSGSARLWVRWSWRDLRRRWLLVLAIGVIVAVGTGTYAGLGSTATWRRQTNDASFAALRMHDLRVDLARGATLPAGALRSIVAALPHGGAVRAVSERLVAPTQVDASTDDTTVLSPGQIVGADVRDEVDALFVSGGRLLTPADDGGPVAVLEHQFARHAGLPATGSLRLAGGASLHYVGVGAAPQHLIVIGEGGGLSQADQAIVYLPLATAQRVLGLPGRVNELVLTVAPGAAGVVRDELRAALAAHAGATITTKAEEPAYRLLYEDIDNDQEFWNIIAGLVLAGATFAAFNLTTRMVESQRREIGVGMALGVTPPRLAIRPMLVGAQVAALGVGLGVGFGYLLDVWLKAVFEDVLPMPRWHTPFLPGVFARAAAIGFVLPLLATAIPVWRAVRVQPVDAIRTGHLTARAGRLVSAVSHVPLPGRSYRQMSVRNMLRTPRRTALTALGIGAAITTMVATIGLVDSFVRMLDTSESELTRRTPNRLVVELDGYHPADSAIVRRIATSPALSAARLRLRVAATTTGPGEPVDLAVDLLPFDDDALWLPTLTTGTVDAVHRGGIVLSDKAAADLGLRAGDTVTIRHLRRDGAGVRLVESRLPIAGTHPGPMRSTTFLDLGQAARFGLAGATNVVDVVPAAGTGEEATIRALFPLAHVASVQAVTATTRNFRKALDQYFGVFYVVELIVLVLALLIAFNTSSISVDERTREHATMLAFGLRPRTILSLTVVESFATGLLGTLAGVAGGYLVVSRVVHVQLDRTLPELDVHPFVSLGTLGTAFLLGVVAVALAPLLTARRVRRLDVPAALRVLE